MVIEIFWTKKSVDTYNKVIKYLNENWPEKVTNNFVVKTRKTLHLISINNVKFRSAGQEGIYEVLITKHNLLIYRVKATHVELLKFYDTRQNPRKKKF